MNTHPGSLYFNAERQRRVFAALGLAFLQVSVAHRRLGAALQRLAPVMNDFHRAAHKLKPAHQLSRARRRW